MSWAAPEIILKAEVTGSVPALKNSRRTIMNAEFNQELLGKLPEPLELLR